MNEIFAQVQSLPLRQITVSRHQVRKTFDDDSIKALAASIDKEGLLQPVSVRKVGEGWELIAGERRLRAFRLLGRETIPALVTDAPSEAAAAAKGLVENIQREDLNPMEEAQGYQDLQTLDPDFWTQAQIAEVAGSSQAYISQSFALLKLSDSIQENIRRLIISRAQGVELARISDITLQLEISAKAIGLSHKATRRLVDSALGHRAKKKVRKSPDPLTDPLEGLWPVAHKSVRSTDWEVKFGFHERSPGIREQGWFYFTAPSSLLALAQPGTEPPPSEEDRALAVKRVQRELAAWHEAMARVLRDDAPTGEDGSSDNLAVMLKMKALARQAAVMAQQVAGIDNLQPVRIPNTSEEWVELESLARASQGPGPVYAWIVGDRHSLTLGIRNVMWKDFSESDPVQACHRIVDGCRSMVVHPKE